MKDNVFNFQRTESNILSFKIWKKNREKWKIERVEILKIRK